MSQYTASSLYFANRRQVLKRLEPKLHFPSGGEAVRHRVKVETVSQAAIICLD
jgi:hypothetical protein